MNESATREAERIVALGGVAARNECPKITDPDVLDEILRLERAGKARRIVLDGATSRLHRLGLDVPERRVLPATPEELQAEIQASGEQGCLCAEIDASDRPCVNDVQHVAPIDVSAPTPPTGNASDHALVVLCTRCRETTATGDEEVEKLFGFRTVPGTKADPTPRRRNQPQCRKCRSLPPAGKRATVDPVQVG